MLLLLSFLWSLYLNCGSRLLFVALPNWSADVQSLEKVSIEYWNIFITFCSSWSPGWRDTSSTWPGHQTPSPLRRPSHPSSPTSPLTSWGNTTLPTEEAISPLLSLLTTEKTTVSLSPCPSHHSPHETSFPMRILKGVPRNFATPSANKIATYSI